MPGAEVTLFDGAGRVFAKGVGDEKYNFLHLIHPTVGDCHEIESASTTSRQGRSAWQDCYEQLATWVPEWVGEVRSAQVNCDGCRFDDIVVTLEKSNSHWYLWWVPMRHLGGKPYTYYRGTISVNAQDCIQEAPAGKSGTDLFYANYH